MSDLVLLSRNDAIATLTLNRPDKRNALSTATIRALRDRLAQLADDRSVHVIVLTGCGDKAFCAGGDLSDIAGDGLLDMHHRRGAFADLLVDIQRQPQPIIARLNGDALGGGFGLALASDIAIAATHANLGTPEINVGVFPMMIMALIRRHVGPKATLHMMYTGERFSAARALELGCVNRVVPADELDKAVDEVASKIASYSPAILRLGRQAYYKTQDMDFEQSLRALHTELTLTTLTEDAAEGISAFIERRPPQWSGK